MVGAGCFWDFIGDGIIDGKTMKNTPELLFLLHMAIGKELVGQK